MLPDQAAPRGLAPRFEISSALEKFSLVRGVAADQNNESARARGAPL